MIKSCVHTHTVFCDGQNTMQEMAESACKAGLELLGFSGHSYIELDSFGIKSSDIPLYINEVLRVKNLYNGQLDILCGIELDSFAHNDYCHKDFDYVIGSAHGVLGADGNQYIIDGSYERLVQAAKLGFNGSFRELYTAYYTQFLSFLKAKKPDIIGHFDLITKYNEKHFVFDDSGEDYKSIAIAIIDEVLKTESVIELNTGAVARGYKTLPYPSKFLLERILQQNGKIIITTDAHTADTLTYWAKEAEEYLLHIGFETVVELGTNGFYERKI